MSGRVMVWQPSAAGFHALQLVQRVVRRHAGFMLNPVGRSPDLRFTGPVGLPIPCGTVALF